MDTAHRADMAKAAGNDQEARSLYGQALQLEQRAIASCDEYSEPTYSLIHRSAAWLAMECGEYRTAERLAAAALSRDPPDDIAEELRSAFGASLAAMTSSVGDTDIQIRFFSAHGDAAEAPWQEFRERINAVTTLCTRIVERKLLLPFRPKGAPTAQVRQACNFRLTPAVPGSYAVTVRMGGARPLVPPGGGLSIPEVIGEFMDLVELADADSLMRLPDRIPDIQYCRNAALLTRRIAPDGDRIQSLRFRSNSLGASRSVGMRRPAKQIRISGNGLSESTDGNEAVTVTGALRYADATGGVDNRIRVMPDDSRPQTIMVPVDMMADIVKPMWDTRVAVTAVSRHGVLHLLHIEPAPND